MERIKKKAAEEVQQKVEREEETQLIGMRKRERNGWDAVGVAKETWWPSVGSHWVSGVYSRERYVTSEATHDKADDGPQWLRRQCIEGKNRQTEIRRCTSRLIRYTRMGKTKGWSESLFSWNSTAKSSSCFTGHGTGQSQLQKDEWLYDWKLSNRNIARYLGEWLFIQTWKV